MDSWLQEAAKEGFEEDIIPQETVEEQMVRHNQERAKGQFYANKQRQEKTYEN